MKNIIVVKLGGNVVSSENSKVLQGIKELHDEGNRVIIVHGGGETITHYLDALSIPFEKIDGLRATSKEVLEVTTMVLSGKVNKELVAKCTQSGLPAIGISGCDGGLLHAEKSTDERLGFVGDVKSVNTTLLEKILEMNYIPVVSPIGSDQFGQLYNLNADTAAVSIAVALEADELLYATDVEGVLINEEVVSNLTKDAAIKLRKEGIITGGMIPKVMTALWALENNVNKVRIVNGLHGFSKFSGTQFISNEVEELLQ